MMLERRSRTSSRLADGYGSFEKALYQGFLEHTRKVYPSKREFQIRRSWVDFPDSNRFVEPADEGDATGFQIDGKRYEISVGSLMEGRDEIRKPVLYWSLPKNGPYFAYETLPRREKETQIKVDAWNGACVDEIRVKHAKDYREGDSTAVYVLKGNVKPTSTLVDHAKHRKAIIIGEEDFQDIVKAVYGYV